MLTSHIAFSCRLRVSLLTALGVAPLACGGVSDTNGPTTNGAGAAAMDSGGEPALGTGATGIGGSSMTGYVPLDRNGRVACTDPFDDQSGLTTCREGYSHRPVSPTCRLPESAAPAPSGGSFGLLPGFCLNDEDCEANQACICSNGFEAGRCWAASCRTDNECGAAEVCTYKNVETSIGGGNGCGTVERLVGLACDRPKVPSSGGSTGYVPCGRPFLVQSAARVAPVIASADWKDAAVQPALSHLSLGERAALAEHWTRMGQMEHASIAAFARFSLQLLALGAPSALVEACTQALADETAHTKLCFRLASAYAGRALAPGLLNVHQSLEATSLVEIVELVIAEGCFGETSAALEALEAAASATDPVVVAAYSQIARDEQRHAELAFRFVRWALEQEPETVRDRIATTIVSAQAVNSVARGVVVPCLEALLRDRLAA